MHKHGITFKRKVLSKHGISTIIHEKSEIKVWLHANMSFPKSEQFRSLFSEILKSWKVGKWMQINGGTCVLHPQWATAPWWSSLSGSPPPSSWLLPLAEGTWSCRSPSPPHGACREEEDDRWGIFSPQLHLDKRRSSMNSESRKCEIYFVLIYFLIAKVNATNNHVRKSSKKINLHAYQIWLTWWKKKLNHSRWLKICFSLITALVNPHNAVVMACKASMDVLVEELCNFPTKLEASVLSDKESTATHYWHLHCLIGKV